MANVTIAAVGDVLIDRLNPLSALAEVKTVFDAADITFGNFEGVITDRHPSLPGAASAGIVQASNAAGLGQFDVLSLANNHAIDAGYGGLEDTLAAMRVNGIKPVGAGLTPAAAWQPVVITTGGQRVAFVAVTSVCRVGYDARGHCGGVASLMTVDHYAPRYPAVHLPGLAPQIISVTNAEDWRQLEAAIAFAHQQADIVVVSMHWGDHTRPYVITDFERDTAKRLSELGVNLVLGHHQHYLRGVEFIGSMPAFFGLGHIVFDLPGYVDELKAKGVDWLHLPEPELERRFGRFGFFPRPSGFPFNDLARWTGIAIIEFSSSSRPAIGFVPAHIDADGIPRAVLRDSDRWRSFLGVMHLCMEEGYLACTILDEGQDFGGFPLLVIQSAS